MPGIALYIPWGDYLPLHNRSGYSLYIIEQWFEFAFALCVVVVPGHNQQPQKIPDRIERLNPNSSQRFVFVLRAITDYEKRRPYGSEITTTICPGIRICLPAIYDACAK